MNFFSLLKYDFLKMCRDKGYLFWVIIYPVLLSTFFSFAFSGLNERPSKIDIAVVDGNGFKGIANKIDLLNVIDYKEGQSQEDLKSGKIRAIVDSSLNMTIKKPGLGVTILSEVLNTTKQMTYLRVFPKNGLQDTSYIKEESSKSNPMSLPFYSLIAMVSLYSIYRGIDSVTEVEANQSPIGVRFNTSPLKKSYLILSSTITSVLFNMFSNIVLLLFLINVLKYNFITNIGLSIIIILLGNLIGNSIGTLIGALLKISNKAKNNLAIGITLIGGAITGMMNPELKSIVDSKFPLVKLFNPQSLITTELYKVNW